MSDQERPYPDGVAAIFEIARRLRAPEGGCPWDREQTHLSLRPYLLEETYELLEVIDRGEDDGKLLEELGDVLLQVAMHAAIAEEEGRFDAARVSEAAAAKMVARHPHVFGDEKAADAAAPDGQRVFEELGDLLFAVVSLSRKLKVNPEDALRAAGQRFRDRFEAMDREARRRGISYRDLSPSDLESLWRDAR